MSKNLATAVCTTSCSLKRESHPHHRIELLFQLQKKQVMGSKRAYSEVEAPGTSRDGGYKKRKQFKTTRATSRNDGNSAAPAQSLNEVKKRARDIQRRFAKTDKMPADIQRNLERELAHCKRQIEDLAHKKKRSDMIGKYHHVRFFGMCNWRGEHPDRDKATSANTLMPERQKAERLRKQLRKRLEDAEPEDKAKLEGELHIADVDWHYAKYFPFMERYVGLYLSAKTSEASADKPIAKRALHSERPPMWKEIETAMEQGERALVAIQERTLAQDASHSRETSANPVKKLRQQSKAKEQKQGKSKSAERTRQETAVRGGTNPQQEEAEEEIAEEGNDGMGFFAIA